MSGARDCREREQPRDSCDDPGWEEKAWSGAGARQRERVMGARVPDVESQQSV